MVRSSEQRRQKLQVGSAARFALHSFSSDNAFPLLRIVISSIVESSGILGKFPCYLLISVVPLERQPARHRQGVRIMLAMECPSLSKKRPLPTPDASSAFDQMRTLANSAGSQLLTGSVGKR